MGNIIIIILAAYLLGNISPAYIIGKLTANIDIREYGSGNAGTTNVMRTLGKRAAFLTLLLDCLKGALAVLIGKYLAPGTNMHLYAGIIAVIGHNWPILLKFKGGKGVATTIGAGIAVFPSIAFLCIGIGIIILMKFKYVSLSSMTGVTLFAILMFFQEKSYFIFALTLCIFVLYRHRENIQRLLNGTERKVTDRLKVN